MGRPVTEPLMSFLAGLRPGQIVTGTVASIPKFGVFVNLDGEPAGYRGAGFIQLPELSWRYVDHMTDVVAVGQRLTLKVIYVDREFQLQALVSLKEMQEDPFISVADRVGEVATGPIEKITSRGAFVDIAGGIVGFLPPSDFGPLVREGDTVTVRIVAVNLQRRQVLLAAAPAAVDRAPGELA